ncbi:hypothetical protein [Vibrio sp. 99-70-13A1]|uniref:hypothetical protein n=1 Tax=Vibrio sp. 99-70-13A1 TaxID=2607601 RepID=UPI00149352CE|nr:hypothetical protein [Vibrio sp. 99-70-13A1]NOH97516.1 hypothetical protein [Vibrio sp. 99-70-13A1]
MKLKALSILIASSYACMVTAADMNVNQEAKAAKDPHIANLSLVQQLADVGFEQKDPLILMTAAKIYAMTPTKEMERTKESEGGVESKKTTDMTVDFDSLLDYAKEYSGDNESYLAMISEIESVKTRGRTSGPAISTDRVEAGATDTYYIRYRGDRLAELMIIGDGDTDLDVYVYDERGNSICKDDDYSDKMYCSWVPAWTGEFEIKIKNRGNVYNVYDILTN